MPLEGCPHKPCDDVGQGLLNERIVANHNDNKSAIPAPFQVGNCSG